jgi:hypothetical protein
MNIAQILKNNKNFHPDLVSHILFNLPAKSVFRFKLLSNFWHNQISNPCFRDMYHKQAKKNHSVLFYKNLICSTENGAENQTETEWISLNHKTLLDNDTFISRGNVWSTKPVICHSMVCFCNTKYMMMMMMTSKFLYIVLELKNFMCCLWVHHPGFIKA